jgi:hypothetical protein
VRNRAGLSAVEKRTISCPYPETNPGRLANSLVAIPTALSLVILLSFCTRDI